MWNRAGIALATAMLAAGTLFPADLTEEEAKAKGWQLYLEARNAAGTGEGGAQISDYTYDLASTIDTPQGPAKFTSKWTFVVPHYLRQDVQTPNGAVTLIFDGEKAWQAEGDDIKYLPNDAVAQIKTDLARNHVLLDAPPPAEMVRFLKREEIEGKPVDVIQLADVGGTPLRLFIDPASKLVVKLMFVGDTPSGMAQVEEFLYNHQRIGGYQWPQHTEVLRNGKKALESERTNMKVNQGLTRGNVIR